MDENKTLATQLVSNTPMRPSTIARMFRLQYPTFPIIVRGEVTGLRPWPHDNPSVYYGDISDENFTLEFQVPPINTLRATGQFIEIIGTIKEKPNNNAKTCVPILKGEVVGEYEPAARPAFVLSDTMQMEIKIPLKSFLREHSKMGLGFLATKNGFNDFLHACNDPHKVDNLVRLDANFIGKQNVIDSIRKVKTSTVTKGIVILRGGRTNNDDLRVWNDIDVLQELYKLNMPFYTAIGHASDLLLVDKHAHESFITPTMFGNQYREVLNAIYWDSQRDAKITSLEYELKQQAPRIEKLRRYLIVGALVFSLLLFLEVKYSMLHHFIHFLTHHSQ